MYYVAAADVTQFSAVANATGLNSLLDGTSPSNSSAFYHLPGGVQALFHAVMEQEQLNILLNTSVSDVTEDGNVTLAKGTSLQFDIVIVTIRPPAAAAIVPLQLQPLYANASTQLRDVWIFNATLLSNATLPQILSGQFAAQVTTNGTLAPSNGYRHTFCVYMKAVHIYRRAVM